MKPRVQQDVRFARVQFSGTQNIIMPVAICIDPILSKADVRVWSALRILNHNNELEGSTYILPKLACVSRPQFINSCNILEIFRFLKTNAFTDENGMHSGKSFELTDIPFTLKFSNYGGKYIERLKEFVHSKHKRTALIAEYALKSINHSDQKASHEYYVRAINQYQKTGVWRFGQAAPEFYPIHDDFVDELLSSLKRSRSGSKTSLPPEEMVDKRFNHGGKTSLPPKSEVDKPFYHRSKTVLPPENEVVKPVYHEEINDLDPPSRTRANVVCSSSYKNNNKTNNDEVKEIHTHIRARLELYEETDVISKKQNNQLFKVFEDLDAQTACELIDEVIGQIINKSKQRDQINNLPGYAMSLKKRYNDGTYVPTSCVQFANELLANAEAVKRSNSLANAVGDRDVKAEDVPVKSKRNKKNAKKAMDQLLKVVGKKI